jgi:hypothetical protein
MLKIQIQQNGTVEARGLNKFIGLMFKSKYTNPLSFTFDKPVYYPIHSYFVFFPFVAEWYLTSGNIEYKIIYPFTNNIKPSKPFMKLIEYPLIKIEDIVR